MVQEGLSSVVVASSATISELSQLQPKRECVRCFALIFSKYYIYINNNDNDHISNQHRPEIPAAKATTTDRRTGTTTAIPAETDAEVEKKLGAALRTCCEPNASAGSHPPTPRRVVAAYGE